MSDEKDNVLPFPLGSREFVTSILAGLESLKPPRHDPELALWDDIVRMQMGLVRMSLGKTEPVTVDEAIETANKVVAARRKFAAQREAS